MTKTVIARNTMTAIFALVAIRLLRYARNDTKK